LQRVTILCALVIGGAAATLSAAPAPSARGVVTKPPAKQGGAAIRGIDVSAYQHTGAPINWNSLAKQGLKFVAIKVSEGTYYVNQYYRQDAQAAAKSGLAILPYVFANPSEATGPATARFAVRAAGQQLGRLPFVVDLENDPYVPAGKQAGKKAIKKANKKANKRADDCYGLQVPAMISWIAGFSSETEALTGQAPIIYTTSTWWQECTGNTARFRRDPLWLAAFDSTPPTVPPPWERWSFWQYNSHGSLPGLGQTDLDYFQPTGAFPALIKSVKASKSVKSGKPAPKKHTKQQAKQQTKQKSRKPSAPS
jgi:GH25 family lysozyme M1 (1,4-beta-N-acetylmuramidase)